MTNRQTNDQVVVNTAKMTLKKKLLIALCAVVGVTVIVATSVLATVAYLTGTAMVTNTFTVGKVTITLLESKVHDNGELYDGGATKVNANTYKLMDGMTYTKDPVLEVLEGSENSYLFILVRNDIESIEDEEKETIADQLAANGWAKYKMASTGWVYVYIGADQGAALTAAGDANKTSTGTFDYTAITAGVGKYNLFSTFSIDPTPSRPTTDFEASASIKITAYAIQDSGFNNIDEAWAAVVQTYPYIHTGTN